jgi:uncharacterized protein YacL
MNPKKFFQTFVVFLSIFIVFSFLYLFSFSTNLFSTQKILFYRGIYLLVVVFFINLILLFFLNKKFFQIPFELIFSFLVLSLSFHLVFFVLFPVTFDRSVTMYLLNQLEKNKSSVCQQGLTKEDLEKSLIEEYVKKDDAVGRRIFEQKETGFLEEKNQCLSVNKKGEQFLRFAQLVKKIYRIK